MSPETLDGNSFPLLRGQCKIDDEGVHISTQRKLSQGQITFRMVMSVLVIIYFIYRAIETFNHGPIGITIMFSFVILLNFYLIIFSLNATVIADIPWGKIRSITYKKGFILSIRPVITVRYTDENNKPKKRILVLPNMFKNGNDIMNQARNILNRFMD